MKRSTESPSRRFHRRARDKVKLRRWEVALWSALFARHEETRLWAAAFADGLRVLYNSSRTGAVLREIAWVRAPRGDYIGDFDNLAEALGVDAESAKRDILADVREGRIKATVVLP